MEVGERRMEVGSEERNSTRSGQCRGQPRDARDRL